VKLEFPRLISYNLSSLALKANNLPTQVLILNITLVANSLIHQYNSLSVHCITSLSATGTVHHHAVKTTIFSAARAITSSVPLVSRKVRQMPVKLRGREKKNKFPPTEFLSGKQSSSYGLGIESAVF